MAGHEVNSSVFEKGTTMVLYVRKTLLNKMRLGLIFVEYFLLNIFWDGPESNNLSLDVVLHPPVNFYLILTIVGGCTPHEGQNGKFC